METKVDQNPMCTLYSLTHNFGDIEIIKNLTGERLKCLIFYYEMSTLQKVGGEDSKGRRVL